MELVDSKTPEKEQIPLTAMPSYSNDETPPILKNHPIIKDKKAMKKK